MNSLNFNSTDDAVNYINKTNNKGYLLHVPIDKVTNLSEQVGENVVLCSTAGEYTSSGYKNGVISGFEFARDEGSIVEILYPPVRSLKNLKESYEKVKFNPNAFMLLCCNGLSGMEEAIITTLYFMDDNFKIIGGSAGDNCRFQETLIYIGNKRVHSAAIFFDVKKRTQIIKENIFMPSNKKLLVTDADPINRIVKTLNNKPASAEYARMLGVNEAELSNCFINHPLGKIFTNDIFIASPMRVNFDKSITFYCQVMPNTFVYILDPVEPVAKIRDTLKTLSFKPNFIYLVNCILRSSKFQKEGLWPGIDRELLKVCTNITGFVSYGEQFYKHHVNQTMVMLAVE